MRKVYQDDFSPAKGNALQAAVASIFDLDLDEVPNFIESPYGYDAAIQAFYDDITAKRGSLIMKINLLDVFERTGPVLYAFRGWICILRGKSPRGDFGHVVVARYTINGNFEMIHDPHPDGTFLDESEAFGWCLFFS